MNKNKFQPKKEVKFKFNGRIYRPFFKDLTQDIEQLKSFENLNVTHNGDVFLIDNNNKLSYFWGNLYSKELQPIPLKHHEINIVSNPGFKEFGNEKFKSNTSDSITGIADMILSENIIDSIELFEIWVSKNGVKYHSFKFGDSLIIVDIKNHKLIKKIIENGKEYEVPNSIYPELKVNHNEDFYNEDEIKLTKGYKEYLIEEENKLRLSIFDRQQIKNKNGSSSKILGLIYKRK